MTLLSPPQTLLPTPNNHALQHSQHLSLHIQSEIDSAGGWINFARYMHLALYTPELGYYSSNVTKFGSAGDFVTAPEISPLFAQTLARQVAQILQASSDQILELGAGTGRLAAGLLTELTNLGKFPACYKILEVSAHLQQVQRETLQAALPEHFMQRIEWLDSLPPTFSGLVLGNEILDAIPVHIISQYETSIHERGVAWDGQNFIWADQALTSGHLFDLAHALSLPPGYTSEFCPAATGLLSSLATMLQTGVILFIDYGFSQREYYHPQRHQGTLMCHYRQYAHDNPFFYPGLQDITAHVDFTRLAEIGLANGLLLLGYCNQTQFLINCGITEILAQNSPEDMAKYLPLVAQAQKLLSPNEMGELFKTIAFGKNVAIPLLGFAQGDKRHTL
ncbi:MAG: class I SAM-dependent methyltransferase [Methylophilaceae bacterium]|nr:class I SAM-dependent methyltransferase [Methylophilaceae bacterium]